MRRKASQGGRLGTELPQGHRTIARCGLPRSRLPGVRDRPEAPDPLEDLPEEILRQRDLSQLEGDVAAVWLTTVAPILMSLSRSVVRHQ